MNKTKIIKMIKIKIKISKIITIIKIIQLKIKKKLNLIKIQIIRIL